MSSTEKPNTHQGRNLKRFREMLGWKQEALALALGNDWSQKRVSLLEGKETIEDDLLNAVAAVLKVPVEAIKNFDEEKAVYNIQNNYEGANSGAGTLGQYLSYENCTFNPIEKWLEVIDENKKLYERLLASEQEKVEILKNK